MRWKKLKGNGAIFSKNKKCRFILWRIWDDKKPIVMFVGLNPSKANETQNDNTITRVINFSKDWGYGGVYMLNLFPHISTKSKELNSDLGILKNHLYFWTYAQEVNEVVFAWGSYKKNDKMKEQADFIKEMLQEKAKYLLLNNDGSPRHPLYVPGNTKLKKFIK